MVDHLELTSVYFGLATLFIHRIGRDSGAVNFLNILLAILFSLQGGLSVALAIAEYMKGGV